MIIEFIEHKDINKNELEKICILKKQHWDYSIEKQMQWINCNLSNNDVHLLLKENDEILFGYLNLVKLSILLDDKSTNMIGIGNVCVDNNYQKNQYGFFLMKTAEYYLRKKKENGILLCKEKLIPFYDTIRWNRYNGITKINETTFNGVVYVYDKILSNEIIINKNF